MHFANEESMKSFSKLPLIGTDWCRSATEKSVSVRRRALHMNAVRKMALRKCPRTTRPLLAPKSKA